MTTAPTPDATDPSTDPRPRVALVTGANKGLGLETARGLVAAGLTVYVGSRDRARGQRAADEVGAQLLVLDVTDDASVHSAAEQLTSRTGSLDVLVNNAAFLGPVDRPTEQVTVQDVRAVHDTNVLGVVRVTTAFLPLLRASAAPVVVNVSSGMGSMGMVTDPQTLESRWPALAYASSKAAVNMLTVQYAKALPWLAINAVDPGFTATDATGGQGKPVGEGARQILQMALLHGGRPSGTFSDAAGPLPW